MLERVSHSKRIDEIMVVTTIETQDVPIVHLVSGLGYRVFAGSVDDVLDRYYQAAKLIQPDYVIRLTADCPLFDWRVLDQAIDALDPCCDYLGMISETFPDGQDIEILSFETLKQAWHDARLKSEREHVTLYVRNHPELFRAQDFVYSEGNLNNERWTLDEPEDLAFIRSVYELFAPNREFSMEDIVSKLDENPEVRNLNCMISRNEGLQKSLQDDGIA